ncbi:MAG: putative aminopeptidase [Planctomycetota bacterium]|jgi:predicted aminopeptidase
MRPLISILMLLFLSACTDLGYYWHSVGGHWSIMNKRVDIEELLSAQDTDQKLRERLQLVLKVRQFSIDRLKLPDNGSYRSYAALDHPYAVQSLFAAPEFSTRLHSWCYPIVGCTSYRGYYDTQRLQNYVEKLHAQDFETYVSDVPAYSTLGWFDDPALSSFIYWTDYRLAGLIFHELTHQRIYIDDDTVFNESLASAVQQAGTRLWLVSENRSIDIAAVDRWLAYRDEVIELIETTREQLDDLYRLDIEVEMKREGKHARFDLARKAHDQIAARQGIEAGYKQWFASDLSNAKFGSIAAYNSHLPSFMRILESHQFDFEAFFVYIEKLGQLDKKARNLCLERWSKTAAAKATACAMPG